MIIPETELLVRITGEFREMPGTCLTIAQAARLWALAQTDAARALQRLELAGVLRRTTQGAYRLRAND